MKESDYNDGVEIKFDFDDMLIEKNLVFDSSSVLKQLKKELDFNDFYNINIYVDEIMIQGKATSLLLKKLSHLNYLIFIEDKNFYIIAKKDFVTITLTF